MTLITKYIFKEHAGPFVFALATIIFLFLLNVVFRDLGRLLGKGLSAWVVIEFFVFHLAWILALAVPMSVLVATLMAFGRLSAENEIAALKASGVNLYHLIIPVLVAALFLAIGMERFHNCVLPDFNHRLRILYSDITKKRPTLTLEPHVFFDDIPNFTLLVQEIDEKKDLLKGVVINNYSNPRVNKTIIAREGRLYFSEEQECMVFTLFDGEMHEVELNNLENYRKLKFEQQSIYIPVSNMVMKRSNSRHRGDREKSAVMLMSDVKNNREALVKKYDRIREIVQKDFEGIFPMFSWQEKNTDTVQFTERQSVDFESRVKRVLQQIQGEVGGIKGYRKAISSLGVEIQKKYSIPFACIVFVLIGAPLGIMARQGGLGVGSGLSIVFFLIYWAFLIGGEQLADRRIVTPVVAMWTPNVLVGAGGFYLIVRTIKEATFIPWQQWGSWLKNLGHRRKTT